MVLVLQLALAVVLLTAWQFLSPALDMVFFISTPQAIAESFIGLARSGSLLFHAGITTLEAGLGFLLGGGAGMFAGVLLGRNKLLSDVLQPFLTAFYSLPKAALGPLFILWFGIGLNMKILLAATIVFFIVFLNTFRGVREVSPEQIAILRLMNAKERHLLTKVILPSAIVWVFAGLRLSVPYALIGAIVGEIIASNRGLGYLLSYSASRFDTAGTFAALGAIVILALILNKILDISERRLMPWRVSDAGREIVV
ncbi:ABC transporter permease [Bosea caraganae]|uniref:ABC transporter permease n=1 Tax=Bosea caraganae TaxID=2763117 RepID=A0A370L050_9HYPH|nr:ABC transporter permease [Bosea caraganae]RDJ20634.1 ABC transporter permease [Bosea caraganae]RDJ28911.1 ABC transporter permease [Bosea caraganae]